MQERIEKKNKGVKCAIEFCDLSGCCQSCEEAPTCGYRCEAWNDSGCIYQKSSDDKNN